MDESRMRSRRVMITFERAGISVGGASSLVACRSSLQPSVAGERRSL